MQIRTCAFCLSSWAVNQVRDGVARLVLPALVVRRENAEINLKVAHCGKLSVKRPLPWERVLYRSYKCVPTFRGELITSSNKVGIAFYFYTSCVGDLPVFMQYQCGPRNESLPTPRERDLSAITVIRRADVVLNAFSLLHLPRFLGNTPLLK